MKPNVQYLLECYVGDKLFETSDDDIERSTEGEDYLTLQPSRPMCVQNQSWRPEAGEMIYGLGDFFPVIQAADINPAVAQAGNQDANARIYASLNAHQRQQIRHLARTLKASADTFPIKPLRSLLSVEKAILQNENLDAEELQVVNNIHSIKSSTAVSTIAEYLREKLTSRTFRAALRFICYSASCVSEELALVCELAKETQPNIKQLSRTNSIYDVISEFIEDKLNAIVH